MTIEMQEKAFRNVILPLKDKFYRLALRITLDSAEAEDIVQDTLIRIWEKRDETHTVVRFATSWATRMEDVEALIALL